MWDFRSLNDKPNEKVVKGKHTISSFIQLCILVTTWTFLLSCIIIISKTLLLSTRTGKPQKIPSHLNVAKFVNNIIKEPIQSKPHSTAINWPKFQALQICSTTLSQTERISTTWNGKLVPCFTHRFCVSWWEFTHTHTHTTSQGNKITHQTHHAYYHWKTARNKRVVGEVRHVLLFYHVLVWVRSEPCDIYRYMYYSSSLMEWRGTNIVQRATNEHIISIQN